jgi:type IV pilus assembly protein PilN
MVYINLLPIREIKKRTNAIQQLSLFGVCFVSILFVIGAFWFYQTSIISGLGAEIATLTQKKQQYTKILAQIAKLEEDKKLIESKIAVINELQKTKSITVHILDEIAKLTPSKRMWLTSLDQSGMSVRLLGMALDNQTIAKYMETLRTSEYVADVNLLNTSLTVFAGRNLKSFTLSCSIVLPGADDPEAEADSGTKQQ